MELLPDVFPGMSLAVRTNYDDEDAWVRLREQLLAENEDGFQARPRIEDDPRLAGLSTEEVVALLPPGYQHSFLIIVDNESFTSAEGHVLLVDLHSPPVRPPFRVIPRELWSVENNLVVANMDFFEFADSADSDGVFRGF